MEKNNIKLPIALSVVFLSLIAIAGTMVFKGEISERGNSATGNTSDGFTFFEVGPGTKLTNNLRSDLGKILGSGSVETWSTVNLEFLDAGFLDEHFPRLAELNRKLNDEQGQRIEHNTVKLTYRYIPQEVYPFDYAELLFSDYSGNPLYCRIRAKKSGEEILSVLESKYGAPNRIQRGGDAEFSYYWEKSGDILIYSNTPDLLGNPGYRIAIYYVGNLENMIYKERRGDAAGAEEKEDALKRAF